MNVPVNIGTWLIAALPIIVLLVLMVKFQVGAAKAAPIGILIAFISAVTVFKAGVPMIAYESIKGVWSALSVLIVVWPAILLYELVNEANAFQVFKTGFQKFSPNELIQILLIARIFASFLQGITGFGVPVAVAAPLLAGIGVSPVWAVLFSLFGHAWGNTFGTLAVGWDALVLQTNLSADPEMYTRTLLWATCFIWVWNFVTGVAICWFYGRKEGLKKGMLAVVIFSVIQGGGQVLVGLFNPTLACFVPCCISLVAGLLLGRTRFYNQPWRIEASPVMNRGSQEKEGSQEAARMTMNQAFSPYYVLTVITLFVLLVPSVKNFLGTWKIGFSFPETQTGYGYVVSASEMFSPLSPLTHAGFFLLLSAVYAYLYFSKNGWITVENGRIALQHSIKKTIPSGTAVICFLIMSKIMSGTAQTQVLADGIARVLGNGYVILAPVVGLLGSFMTSSNMSSNILFGEFQLATAKLLELNIPAILGSQTAGGAVGSTMCPGNIVLGATTTGISGREGEILRRVLPVSLSAALAMGIFLFVVTVLL